MSRRRWGLGLSEEEMGAKGLMAPNCAVNTLHAQVIVQQEGACRVGRGQLQAKPYVAPGGEGAKPYVAQAPS